MTNFQLLVAPAVVIILLLQQSGAALSLAVTTKDDTFEYLMLSQEWPFSFCTENKCNYTNKLKPVFNIHGLWPEHVNGECHGKFNYSQLQPLEKQLRQAWMDLKDPNGSPKEFWRHEYDKHGSCATVDPRFNTTLKYFQAGLTVYLRHNMTHILKKAGIVPGPTPYKVSKIIDVVTSAFGYRPEVDCFAPDKHSKNSGVIYLRELHVCVDKDLTPRECNSSALSARIRQDRTLFYNPTLPGRRSNVKIGKMSSATTTEKAKAAVEKLPSLCKPEDHVLLPDGLK